MSKILVVDDEEPLLELVAAILKGQGYEVRTAGGGQQALDLLSREEFDLMLLDVMMPEMDGWDVVKMIKKDPLRRNMPIAMLTVKSMSPQYFFSDEIEGLVDYINKPFSKQELIDRVEKIFEEVKRIETIKEGLATAPTGFLEEYEEISRSERLYNNLMQSLEYSLSKMEKSSHDYKLIKDAIDYGKVLLDNIADRKTALEDLIRQG